MIRIEETKLTLELNTKLKKVLNNFDIKLLKADMEGFTDSIETFIENFSTKTLKDDFDTEIIRIRNYTVLTSDFSTLNKYLTDLITEYSVLYKAIQQDKIALDYLAKYTNINNLLDFHNIKTIGRLELSKYSVERIRLLRSRMSTVCEDSYTRTGCVVKNVESLNALDRGILRNAISREMVEEFYLTLHNLLLNLTNGSIPVSSKLVEFTTEEELKLFMLNYIDMLRTINIMSKEALFD